MDNLNDMDVIQDKARARKKNIRTVICFVILFLATLLGGLVGLARFKFADVIYESEATFRLEFRTVDPPIEGLDWSRVANDNHAALFAQSTVVVGAVHKHDLNQLPSFQDIPEPLIGERILENLSIQQNEQEPTLYDVSYRSSNSRDSQTVLSCLIDCYERSIKDRQDRDADDYRNRLGNLVAKHLVEFEEAKIKNNKESMLELKTKVAGVNQKIERLNEFGNLDGKRFGTSVFSIAKFSTRGKLVAPILMPMLLIGAASGFAIGFGLIVFWFIIRVLS